MTERVDVAIAGSGFGGSIAAWRLAELYEAAGEDPGRVVVLERGGRHRHTDFKQSMHIDHLSDVYRLIQGQGAQMVVANGVGGGSTLYLAASIRAPSGVFERPEWPARTTRRALDPYYRRAELALRVNRPGWDQVSKSGGLWAANLAAAGHTCDRVPLAIDPGRCVNAKWCHTGCVFGAKNTVTTNYLASAERAGVRVLPGAEVQLIRQSAARPYRYSLTTADGRRIECKALVLACGAMGTAPLLMRSRPFLPSLSPRLGRHLGVNGDHVAAIEYRPDRVRDVLGLPGYADFHKGKPITTMTYDFWTGRRPGERFTLQEIFLSTLTNFLYDDGRSPGGEPSWWGLQKKQAVASWANRIEILAMVEDSNDGEFIAGELRPNEGPVSVGAFRYELSERSRAVRAAADDAIRRVASHRGLGRFMRLSETDGAYAAHPLGGCRIGATPDDGVADEHGAVHGYEGLFCLDSSIVPTPLGVNPSLTIAALAERGAEALVRRGADLGLPSVPAGFSHGVPDEIVGDRVLPGSHSLSMRAAMMDRASKLSI